jgi:hypothetical protein
LEKSTSADAEHRDQLTDWLSLLVEAQEALLLCGIQFHRLGGS